MRYKVLALNKKRMVLVNKVSRGLKSPINYNEIWYNIVRTATPTAA